MDQKRIEKKINKRIMLKKHSFLACSRVHSTLGVPETKVSEDIPIQRIEIYGR